MPKAIEVARYLVNLAATEDEPDYLTPLRLQKLLYYVQGWSLAIRERPMFSERIEAWANGPVVRDVYREFSAFARRSIVPEDVETESGPDLTDEEKEFIHSVWEALKGHSASSLWKMTHEEPTWLNARNGAAPTDRCDEEISHESMRTFFAQHVE